MTIGKDSIRGHRNPDTGEIFMTYLLLLDQTRTLLIVQKPLTVEAADGTAVTSKTDSSDVPLSSRGTETNIPLTTVVRKRAAPRPPRSLEVDIDELTTKMTTFSLEPLPDIPLIRTYSVIRQIMLINTDNKIVKFFAYFNVSTEKPDFV